MAGLGCRVPRLGCQGPWPQRDEAGSGRRIPPKDVKMRDRIFAPLIDSRPAPQSLQWALKKLSRNARGVGAGAEALCLLAELPRSAE
jgi:hypothetical protein